jgi:hypothetical protein
MGIAFAVAGGRSPAVLEFEESARKEGAWINPLVWIVTV